MTFRVRYLNKRLGEIVKISQYPNFHYSGSISGMKRMFYGKDAMLVRCGQWIYNVPASIYNISH